MSTILAKVKRYYSTTEAGLSLIAKQWAYAEDTRRIVAMEADGSTKRYYWDSTRLADQTGAYGAALVGVLGITGVTPTGGSANASGTLQAMLEGIASGAVSPTGSVILAPASSARNVIQPTNATTNNLILKMYAGQSVPPFIVQDSAGAALFTVQYTGGLSLSASASSGLVSSVANSNNANSAAHAQQSLQTAGASAGDPYTYYQIVGGTQISVGIDNTDSKYKISNSSTLGTSDRFTIDTAGKILVNSSVDTGKPQFGVGGNIGFGDGAGTAWASLTTSSATSFRFLPFKYWDGSTWTTQNLVCVQ